MNFLKRIKPIKVDLYTGHGNAHRLFKPCYAKDYKPNWLSKVKVTPDERHVKHCYGLRQSFSTGFVIPLWADIVVHTEVDSVGEVSSRSFQIPDQHTVLDQIKTKDGFMEWPNRSLYKIVSPWYAVCDEDVDFVMMENMFSQAPYGAEFVSGVVQFKQQHATNMFLYLQNVTQMVRLTAGDVPVIFKPLSERPLQIKSHYDPDKHAYYNNLSVHQSFLNFSVTRAKQAEVKNKRIGR